MKNFLTRKNDDNFGGFGFFDNAFDDFFAPAFFGRPFGGVRNDLMRTDVKETDKEYQLSVDMPGYDKKDISVSLDNGYVTISAKREEKEDDKNYIRRERSYSCSRSYYVGDDVKQEDIKAKYESGTLHLTVPKTAPKEITSKNIEIE